MALRDSEKLAEHRRQLKAAANRRYRKKHPEARQRELDKRREKTQYIPLNAWTEEQTDFLRRHWQTKPTKWIAEQIGKSRLACDKKAVRLSLPNKLTTSDTGRRVETRAIADPLPPKPAPAKLSPDQEAARILHARALMKTKRGPMALGWRVR